MIADVTSVLFYVFAAVLMMAAMAVITSKHSVRAVFFLILAFFNAAGLFVLLGAEYLAMTLVIVYVGAVAVLFLFVVMMLNVNFEKLRVGFSSHLLVGGLLAVLLFAELAALLYGSILTPAPLAAVASQVPNAVEVTNAQAIGRVLYTDYLIAFQLSGVILLVAMIGAIVLTHRQRIGVKKQNIRNQLARKRVDGVMLVDVKSGEGI
jgi:NADH-quinone oxidoreductase subunit J